MYSTKTAVVSTNEGGTYMPAGINENVHLKEINVKKSPTGLDFLEIIFENTEGQIASITEWKNTKSQYVKTDEELQNRDNRQFGRILQIIDCFYPEREEKDLASFKEMIDWVKSKLDPMIPTNKALRLKVIFDKNNYTVISKNGIFVEPMTVDKEHSQIKQLARDNFERTIVADRETVDPLASNSTQETVKTGADDLPF